MTDLCKNPGHCKVVVVEDDRLLTMVLAMQLQSAGLNFCTASNGYQAMELVKSHHPKILVLDVSIPGLSGFEVVDAIRQDSSLAELHNMDLIIHTSHDLTKEEKHRLTLGRTLFLTKTRVSDELATMITTLLTETSSDADFTIKC